MKACLAILCLFIAACGSPPAESHAPPPPMQASFDGNQQSSGILSASPTGFLVTPTFLARYDSLAGRYGDLLIPQLRSGDRKGITPEGSNFHFQAEAMERFLVMNTMRRRQ